ncbi:MAG: hypothetical protein RL450_1009 [Actinomycetota bacterium]
MARKALGLRIGALVVAALFLASGVLHLVNPSAFLWLMPPWLPLKTELIVISGVMELASAIGLIFKLRWAPLLTVLTLLAVWPANWWFAIDSLTSNPEIALIAWLRLPLQLPLLYWAYWAEVRKPKIS